MQSETLELDIWRGGRDGSFQTFALALRDSQTILDAVTEIQRTQDASLAYRFACRVGMCGSCAMIVDGIPRWTCRTRVIDVRRKGKRLKLEPLRNLPVVKDLAVDMAVFFDKWRDAKGHFEPGDAPPPDFARVPPDSRERRAADVAIAAPDVEFERMGLHSSYLGVCTQRCQRATRTGISGNDSCSRARHSVPT